MQNYVAIKSAKNKRRNNNVPKNQTQKTCQQVNNNKIQEPNNFNKIVNQANNLQPPNNSTRLNPKKAKALK